MLPNSPCVHQCRLTTSPELKVHEGNTCNLARMVSCIKNDKVLFQYGLKFRTMVYNAEIPVAVLLNTTLGYYVGLGRILDSVIPC